MSSIIRSAANNSVKAAPIVSSAASNDARVSIGVPAAVGQPHIRVIKRNDQVETVEVVCSCGQCITLQLEYPVNSER